jgi:hypothetical protein
MTVSKHSEAQIIATLKQGEGGANGRRCGAGERGQQAHDLCLESEVRWDGRQRSTAAAAAGG